ncbi:hypothetical protein [Prevotella sp.]|nr:hypothetical protein [Prevotella sp.]
MAIKSMLYIHSNMIMESIRFLWMNEFYQLFLQKGRRETSQSLI